jgi:hypothetical protein
LGVRDDGAVTDSTGGGGQGRQRRNKRTSESVVLQCHRRMHEV